MKIVSCAHKKSIKMKSLIKIVLVLGLFIGVYSCQEDDGVSLQEDRPYAEVYVEDSTKIRNFMDSHYVTFDAEFKRLPQSRIEQVIERSNTDTIKDAEFAREVITGWQGVTDAKGADVPYSNEALSKLLDVPLVAGAIVQAFFASLTGAKRKN